MRYMCERMQGLDGKVVARTIVRSQAQSAESVMIALKQKYGWGEFLEISYNPSENICFAKTAGYDILVRRWAD